MATVIETNRNYTEIDRPYDQLMNRNSAPNDSGKGGAGSGSTSDPTMSSSVIAAATGGGGGSGSSSSASGQVSGVNGSVETMPVKSDGSMGDVWITNFIASQNWKPKTVGFKIDGQTGYAEFTNVYVSGNIEALTGTVGGWTINSSSLSSGESGSRLVLDKEKNRISVFDDINDKVVMGYLNGLPKNDGAGNWGPSDYGFWVRAGDSLRIDGGGEYTSGDWLIQNDASYLVKDAAGKTIIRLGTDNGEKGMFIYDTSGIQLAKYTSDQIYIGEPGSSLTYDILNGLVIEGSFSATTGSIGGFNIGPDYIRDSANSFGLSSTVTVGDDVRFWAGDSYANRAVAPFSITESGVVTAKAVRIGGSNIQYLVGDGGMNSFGDGSDGDLSTLGDVTLTQDRYYTNLTINAGHTFNTNGFRIFCSGTFTLNGTIPRNGNPGTAGVLYNNRDVTKGMGGAGLSDGYLKGSVRGGNGGTAFLSGYPIYPESGISVTNSIGTSGAYGGINQSAVSTLGAGSGGSATPANAKLIANWHLLTLLDITSNGSTVKYENSGGSGGGGYGYFGQSPNPWNAGTAGAGGGAGSGGGIIAIYARNIVIGVTGTIIARGGAGGAGSPGGDALGSTWPQAGGGGGGGGGAGGNGGQIILVYNSLLNNGSISVTGGAGGAGGIGGWNKDANYPPYSQGRGASGDAGSNGNVGLIRQFQISL